MRLIESPQNPYIKHLVRLSQNSHYRHAEKKILLEGKKLIQDLLPLLPEATLLSTSETFPVPQKKAIRISPAVAKVLAQTETSEEVFAEVPLPCVPFPEKQLTHLLVLDGVSDPGNLGTLLRTACTLGWQGVFFLPGCCDPFNDKALRASQGALFTLPYQKGSWKELKRLKEKYQLASLAADLKGLGPEEISQQNLMLVLGSEGQGLSSETRSYCQSVTIKMSGKMESLNVASAGAILMYLLRPGHG
jgi:TrmH family RNA methyltransferase